eukprot:365930-Amphidinium_carterae.1
MEAVDAVAVDTNLYGSRVGEGERPPLDVLVPEREVYCSRTGRVIPREKVYEGRWNEAQQLSTGHDVYDNVPPEKAKGKRVRSKWIEVWKDEVGPDGEPG